MNLTYDQRVYQQIRNHIIHLNHVRESQHGDPIWALDATGEYCDRSHDAAQRRLKALRTAAGA